VKHPFHPTSV